MPNPTATIFVPYHVLDDLLQQGTRASQPLASSVTPGTLYSVTDEGHLIERSSGVAWEAYSPSGGGSSMTLAFDYSSAIVAPPTSSQIRFDALHPYTAVTTLWLRPVTTDGRDVQTFLLLIPVGSTVYVQDRNDHTLFARFTTTAAPIDQTTYVEVPVAWHSNGGALLNNQAVEVLVVTGGGGGGAPAAHHTTHEAGGSDVVTLAQSQVTGLTTALGGKVETTDPRLGDARTPTAHHTTHEPGGSDPIANLSASILTSGTLPDARLSANVARRDQANTFLENQTISKSVPRLNFFDSAEPVDQRLFQVVNTSQQLHVHTLTDAEVGLVGVLRLDRTGDVAIGRDLYEKGRSVAMGHWQDTPFTASHYAATGGGTWTIGAAAAATNRYMLIGKTLFWKIYISWFSGSNTVAGTVTGLTITLPGGLSATGGTTMNPIAYGLDAGTVTPMYVSVAGTLATINKSNGTNFTAGAAGLVATMTWEIA